jgi:hypothetical protein
LGLALGIAGELNPTVKPAAKALKTNTNAHASGIAELTSIYPNANHLSQPKVVLRWTQHTPAIFASQGFIFCIFVPFYGQFLTLAALLERSFLHPLRLKLTPSVAGSAQR